MDLRKNVKKKNGRMMIRTPVNLLGKRAGQEVFPAGSIYVVLIYFRTPRQTFQQQHRS